MANISLPHGNVPPALPLRISYAISSFKKARAQRRMYRKTINELSSLSDRELNDLGLCRSMIQDVARNAVYH